MASSLSARTVYLKLHPTARTFAERREVLRVLERFGEVTMFKSYKVPPPLNVSSHFSYIPMHLITVQLLLPNAQHVPRALRLRIRSQRAHKCVSNPLHHDLVPHTSLPH